MLAYFVYYYSPIDPPLVEIRTEMVECGRKRWIKIKGVNVTPLIPGVNMASA